MTRWYNYTHIPRICFVGVVKCDYFIYELFGTTDFQSENENEKRRTASEFNRSRKINESSCFE